MFSLICIWIDGWENNREAGDLRRHRAHYDVIEMVYVIQRRRKNTFQNVIRKMAFILAPSKCIAVVHPCEKVIGIFFQNQIWSRLLDNNRLCLICIKRSIEEVKMCQIYKRGYQKGPSDETLKKARYQFCDVKFGHRITVTMGLFDYKMCNLPQFPLISQTGEARVLFHDLLVLFCINDIFVNYTQLK